MAIRFLETLRNAPSTRIFLTLSYLALAGCTPQTAGGVRALGPSREYSFQIQKPYDVVFQRILEQERGCNTVILGTAAQLPEGDLYTERKFGTITLAMHGALGPQIYQVIDIKAVTAEASFVQAYFPIGPVQREGRRIENWAQGATGCN